MRSHDFTICTGRTQSQEVTAAYGREKLVLAEAVGRFAYRAYDVVVMSLSVGRRDILYAVMGIVESRTYQVGHAGVDNCKTFGGTLLYIEHSGDETAALRHYRAAELKVKLLVGTESEMIAERFEVTLEVGYRMSVRISVIYAEAAPDVD